MALHDTTDKEEADKALAEAQKGVRALRGYLIEMDKKITQHRENNRGLEFNPEWGAMLVKNSLYIYGDIARCNGSALVRAIEPVEKSGETMVTCE